ERDGTVEARDRANRDGVRRRRARADSNLIRRRIQREARRAALGELEAADARAPVELARRRVVLARVPERAVVDRVDRERAVVAPAVAGAGLAAGAVEEMRLTLRELVQRIARQTARVAQLRIDRRARRVE